jgi:hypothetical protein
MAEGSSEEGGPGRDDGDDTATRITVGWVPCQGTLFRGNGRISDFSFSSLLCITTEEISWTM